MLVFYESKFENIQDKLDIENLVYLDYLEEYKVYVYLYYTDYDEKTVWQILNSITEKNLSTNEYYKLTVMNSNRRIGDLDIPYQEYLKYHDRIEMFVF